MVEKSITRFSFKRAIVVQKCRFRQPIKEFHIVNLERVNALLCNRNTVRIECVWSRPSCTLCVWENRDEEKLQACISASVNSDTDPDTVFPIINRDLGKFIYDLEKIDFIIMAII